MKNVANAPQVAVASMRALRKNAAPRNYTPSNYSARSQKVVQTLSRYSNIGSFGEAFGPSLCSKVLESEERAIMSESAPRVIDLAFYGDNAPRAWIEAQISAANIEFGKRMTPYAISSLAASLVADFGGLLVTEVLLFFAKLRAGHYGKFYGAVDGIDLAAKFQTFSRWLMKRRAELSEVARRKEEKAEAERHAAQAITREEFDSMLLNGFDPKSCRACADRDCRACADRFNK